MKSIAILALVASAALLSGCITASTANAIAQDVGPALVTVANQDASAGIIPQAAADAVAAYVPIVQIATSALQADAAACSGEDAGSCALTRASTAAATAEQLLQQPAIAKLVAGSLGPRVQNAVNAAKLAVLAAQDAHAARNATTEAARVADIMAAVFQLNGALLNALQAAR